MGPQGPTGPPDAVRSALSDRLTAAARDIRPQAAVLDAPGEPPAAAGRVERRGVDLDKCVAPMKAGAVMPYRRELPEMGAQLLEASERLVGVADVE